MRCIPPGHISFILFTLMLTLAFCGAPVFVDPDTAWHLAAGDLIRTTHAIPTSDPWSFTARWEQWYNLSWLFDVIASLLFAAGGFSLLYGLTLLIFAGSFAFMAHLCIKRGASPTAVYIILPVAVFATYFTALARPNLCSVILTLLFYQRLHSYRESGKLRDMAILPVLMALWVNLHGGFLLAFAVIGLFCIEALTQHDRTRARGYGFIFAACLVATLINPYGLEIYYGAWRTLSGAFDKRYILEWQSPPMGAASPITWLLLVVLCIGNATDRRIALVDRWLGIVLLVLALCSVRHIAIATLLLLPYATLRLTYLLKESRWGEKVVALDASFTRDMNTPHARTARFALALGAFAFLCLPMPRDALLKSPAQFPKDSFPVAEAAYVLEHYPTLRFFNSYDMGGYLDYLWHGKVKVFVDGRASSLYSPGLLQDFSDIDRKVFGGRAQMLINYYRLDGAIILNTDPNAAQWHWNPMWKVVYTGKVATVYLRNK